MKWLLPWPTRATTNGLYLSQGRRRVLTPQARAWRDEAIAIIRTSGVPCPWGGDALRLSIRGYEPDKRRRDTDGLIKGVQDAVALALDFDDTRIRKVEAERYAKGEPGPDGVAGPCLVVELTEWGAA